MSDYGYSVEVAEGYDEAVIRARLALKSEGFSILSEMHVGGMLGPAAGTERQYLIMGVWNAPFSEKKLDQQLTAAAHMPCNVVVQETGSAAMVAALDPVDALGGEQVVPEQIAVAARGALERVLQKVEASF